MWLNEAGRQAYNGTIALPDSADIHQQNPLNKNKVHISSSGNLGVNLGAISGVSLNSLRNTHVKFQDDMEIHFEDGFKITGKELGDLLKAVKGDYPELFI